MKSNTAIGLMCAGGSLLLLMVRHRPLARRVSLALAIFTTSIGLATTSQYAFGLDFGIDQLLISEPPGAFATLAPGRMAPASAASFLAIGLALILAQSSRMAHASQGLALASGLIGLLPLVGYLYGAQQLYGIGSLTRVAVHAAAAFQSVIRTVKSEESFSYSVTSRESARRVPRCAKRRATSMSPFMAVRWR